MKSDHRHELAENDLSKLLDRGRDRIEPHLNKVLIGLLVATVIVVGGILVYRTQGTRVAAGATELAVANSAAEYQKVAEDFAGTTVGLWARLRAGEEYLRDGIRLSLSNRSASNDALEAAQQAFQQVLRGDNLEREMHEKALYGLAVTLESLTSEQTTTRPALDAYQELLKQFPNSRYKPLAEARIRALENPSTAEFYAWFHAQNPKPDERPQPFDFSRFPAGAGTGNPFEDSEPPADMPLDFGPSNAAEPAPSDSAAPGESTEPTSSDATDSADQPAEPQPASPEPGADDPAGPTLPPATEPSASPPPADPAASSESEPNP